VGAGALARVGPKASLSDPSEFLNPPGILPRYPLQTVSNSVSPTKISFHSPKTSIAPPRSLLSKKTSGKRINLFQRGFPIR